MDTPAGHPTHSSEPPMTCHAVRDDALGTDDAVGIAQRIASREISASEAVAASIERARSVDPELSALVLERFDEAEIEAKTPVAGAFSGVPMMVKDMSDLAGYPTKWGSATLEAAGDATKTAPEIAQMLDMGMIALGKTTLPDFGIICSAEYPDGVPTRNPWNLGHTPGGSSSGSAALVAAGVVPIAHGADGGGSIRIPASACGLVGLKASRGRIIEEPAAKVQPVRVTTHGVLTRSVRDTWTYFAEAEQRFAPKGLAAIGALGNPLESKLRIGVTTATLNGAVIDDATIRVVGETVALLESAGHDVEEIALPVAPTMADDFILNYGFLTLMISKGGRKLFDPSFDPELLTPVVKGFADHCRRNLAKMPGVWRRLRASTAEAEELFKRNDVILTPTVGQVPPPIGYFDTAMSYDDLMERVAAWACFTPWDNATGAPSISLPLGHDPLTNLPVGMLFHAAMGNERLLLELGLQLEAAQPPRSITGSPSGS